MTAWNRIRHYGVHYQEQTVDRTRRLLTANITLIEIDGLPDNAHEGFENQPFDAVTQAARHDGGYVVTKSNVNSTSEDPTYTWPVFAEKWQAENFYSNQYGSDVPPVGFCSVLPSLSFAHIYPCSSLLRFLLPAVTYNSF